MNENTTKASNDISKAVPVEGGIGMGSCEGKMNYQSVIEKQIKQLEELQSKAVSVSEKIEIAMTIAQLCTKASIYSEWKRKGAK